MVSSAFLFERLSGSCFVGVAEEISCRSQVLPLPSPEPSGFPHKLQSHTCPGSLLLVSGSQTVRSAKCRHHRHGHDTWYLTLSEISFLTYLLDGRGEVYRFNQVPHNFVKSRMCALEARFFVGRSLAGVPKSRRTIWFDDKDKPPS